MTVGQHIGQSGPRFDMPEVGFSGIATDLARHPFIDYAVIRDGQLLPVRFRTRDEARVHLLALTSQPMVPA
jgi:hypothetical protein